MESNRFLIVLSLSSAARIPFPSATRALAVSCSSVLIACPSPCPVSLTGLFRETAAGGGGRRNLSEGGRGLDPRGRFREAVPSCAAYPLDAGSGGFLRLGTIGLRRRT